MISGVSVEHTGGRVASVTLAVAPLFPSFLVSLWKLQACVFSPSLGLFSLCL